MSKELPLIRPFRIGSRPVFTGEVMKVLNPTTGGEVGRVFRAGPEHLEEAVERARAAFPELREAPRHQRSRWLQQIASGVQRLAEEFVDLLVEEAGKPVRFARAEVERAVATFTLAAHEAMRMEGEVVPLDTAPAGEGRLGFTRRVPVGPVGALTPFNFPLNLAAHKVAPALAVGSPVLLKPAPDTPLTALLLGEVVAWSGLPDGALSVLPMDNREAPLLVEHPEVPLLSFTGSGEVGWAIKARVPRKKVLLELGGNAPALVHSDADLERAVPRLALGGYAYAGQVCISVQRIFVHEPLYEEFLERYLEEVRRLPVGDPREEETVVGPMIRPREVERVAAWVEEARQAGARVLCGGRAEPPFYHPTVLDRVDPDLAVASREVFGPVTVVAPYRDFPEALEAANDSAYGLQAGVFTRDLARVLESFRHLEFGAVVVNDVPTFRVDGMPYGGVKASGVGREGVRYAMEEMTEPRLLVVRP